MANHDGLQGLCADRRFIDALYRYYGAKKELIQLDELDVDARLSLKEELKGQYLSAIARFFTQIKKLPLESSERQEYIDYLRWNIDIIESELSEFEKDSCPYLQVIKLLRKDIQASCATCLTMSSVDKGVANEYFQAYSVLFRKTNPTLALVHQAGSLFINYVNILRRRFYVDKLDRENLTFTELDSEALFIIEKLKTANSRELAEAVEFSNNQYANFRMYDASYRIGQDKKIQLALTLAHTRATESAFESAIRQLKEGIADIRATLAREVQIAWEATKTVFNPVTHPIDSAKNIWYFLCNPGKCLKEIVNYATKNPWKMCGIVIGGFAIGLLAGGAILGGGALLVNAMVTFAVPHVPWLICGAVGGALGMVAGPLAINGGLVSKMREASENEIAIKKMEILRVRESYKTEGDEISHEVLYEEHRREILKIKLEEARKLSEAHIRDMRDQERKRREGRQNDISQCSEDQLRTLEKNLCTSVVKLEENLNQAKEESRRNLQEIRETAADTFIVMNARAAVGRLMQKKADKNPISVAE